MRLIDIVETSNAVATALARREKIERLAACLRGSSPAEAPVVAAWLSGTLRQGRIGVGPALVHAALEASPEAPSTTLTVQEVDAAFSAIADVQGAGAAARRHELLSGLMGRATEAERRFLARLLYGELRQGAQEGILLEGIARAAGLPVRRVRRAAMLAGDPAAVAAAAIHGGAGALDAFGLRLFEPVLPMLAQSADDVDDALARLVAPEGVALEHKLDGARIQVHVEGDVVRVYTRRLNEVTASVPEIVEAVRALGVRDAILDGEAIALRADGSPHPFQVTMSRFGRKVDIAAARHDVPLTCFFFDCLRLDGSTLIDAPAHERWSALEEAAPETLRVERAVTGSADVAQSFLERALRAGHEGIMAKALHAPYEAGARGSAWIKVKPANTLDLVVLAAEWGHGRRSGWLSNLHLGARDPRTGGFVMLGKTFKGLTDELLRWQTDALLQREVARDRYVVHVRPELVVEVAFNEVQASPRYPGGVALRFARVKGYRPDKTAQEADTIDAVLAIHRAAGSR